MNNEEKQRLKSLETKIQNLRRDLETLHSDVDVAKSFAQRAINHIDVLEDRLNITISDL